MVFIKVIHVTSKAYISLTFATLNIYILFTHTIYYKKKSVTFLINPISVSLLFLVLLRYRVFYRYDRYRIIL